MARRKGVAASSEDDRKIAIYARKSKVTESGKSIEMQITACKERAQFLYEGLKDSDILVFCDEGKSGFYADRPEYVKMLSAIERKEIKAVICYKIDRVSRRTVDLLNFIQQLEKKNVAFVSTSDSDIDTSSRTGKIMIALLASIAEFERDIIAERITDNLYELAKEGRWLGGTTPLGFSSKKDIMILEGKKKTANRLEAVPEEQEVVKKTFELFLKLNSLTGVAEALNNAKLTTRKGNEFTLTAVKNILTNPVYAIADQDMFHYFQNLNMQTWSLDEAFNSKCGMMIYNKTEQIKELADDSYTLSPRYTQKSFKREKEEWIVSVGKHEGLISGHYWIKVQGMIAENAKISARPKEISKSLLSGLVRCNNCGSRMYVRAESGRKNPDNTLRFRYVCDTKYRKKGGCSSSQDAKGWELDNLVIDTICKMSSPTSEYFAQLNNSKKTLSEMNQEQLKSYNMIRKQLNDIQKGIDNQMINIRTAPDEIRELLYDDIKKLATEKETSEMQLAEIESELNTQETQLADIERAKQTLLSFPRLIELVPYEQKLALLNKIIECVIVKDDKAHIFLKGTQPTDFFQKEHERSDLCHRELDSIFYTS